MIGHEAYGASFPGLADYLERGDDGLQEGRIAWHEARNVWAPTVRDAAAVMSVMASGSPTPSPVYHLSVSFDPADPVDRDLMLRVADRLLSDLGLGEHQAVIVAHGDRAHAHFHLMVNRVHPRTGRVWKVDFSWREVERSLRHQERELGLRENPGHLFRFPDQERPDRSASVGAGVLRREERTGEPPYVQTARAELAGDFAAARSYAELEARLAARGHWIEVRPRGLVVTNGRGHAAVSAVSPTASCAKLEKRFGQTFAEYRAARGVGDPGTRERGGPGTRVSGDPAAGGIGDPGARAPGFPGRPGGVAAGPDGDGHAGGRRQRGTGAAPGAGAAGLAWPSGGGADVGPRAGGAGAGGDGQGRDPGSRQDGDGRSGRGVLGADGAVADGGRGVPGGDAGGGGGHGPAAGGGAGQLGGGGDADGEEVRGGARGRAGEVRAGEPAREGGDRPRARALGGEAEAAVLDRGGPGPGGTGDGAEARVEGVGHRGRREPRHHRPPHAAPARLDDERRAAPGAPGGRGGDLHLFRGHAGGAGGDAAREPLEGAGPAGLGRGAPAAGDALAASEPRYTLYEDAGVFGVFDRVGPQVFFAESRERAVAEVARANEIVTRFPTTISMRHLREMDAAWRASRGLPALPEPEGRRIVVPAPASGPPAVAPASSHPVSMIGSAAPAPEAAGWPAREDSMQAVLDLAAQVAARETMRLRVESAKEDLRRTAHLAEELSRATAEADVPLVRFRAALRRLYGEHAPAAEDGFRRVVLERGVGPAVTTLREDPRSLLPAPRPRDLAGGTAARSLAAEQAAMCAPLLERLDRALIDGCDHAGIARPRNYASAAEHRGAVFEQLRQMAPAQRAVLDEALADFQRAANLLASPDQLRTEWARLTESQRDAARTAVPDLERLLRSPSAGLRPAGAGPSL